MNFIARNKYSIFSNIAKYSLIFFLLVSVSLPVFVSGNNGGSPGVNNGGSPGTNNGGSPGVNNGGSPGTNNGGSPAGVNVSVRIENPLSDSISDIPSLVNALFQIVLTIGVPIIALAIIYSGFLFVKARGSPEEITKAKKTLMYTLIGAALLLGSWVIASALKGTVDEISS